MSGGKTRKPESSFDVGAARVSASAPERRERTAEEKAAGARTIAENLGRYDEAVSGRVTAMGIAATAGDLAGWTTAKQAADAGVVQIRELAAAALAAATDAIDAQVRERLAGVKDLLTAAKQRVADARAAPAIRVPVLTCGDALLAVLPPLHIVGPVEPVYAAAESAIKAIFRSQMTWSDIRGFDAIRREHKDHEISRRFGRFGPERQKTLLDILEESKVKAHARALEAAQQQLRRDETARVQARPAALASERDPTSAEPTPASNDAAGVPAPMDRPAPTEGSNRAGCPSFSSRTFATVRRRRRGSPARCPSFSSRAFPVVHPCNARRPGKLRPKAPRPPTSRAAVSPAVVVRCRTASRSRPALATTRR